MQYPIKNKLLSFDETEFALCQLWTVQLVIFKNALLNSRSWRLSPLWFQEFYNSILQVYIRWIFRPVMRYKLRASIYKCYIFKCSVSPRSLLKYGKAITLENHWPCSFTLLSLPIGSWPCFVDPLGLNIIHEVLSSPLLVWMPFVFLSCLTEPAGTYNIMASTRGNNGHLQFII